MIKTSIRFFEDIPVRAVWDDDTSKWWYCAILYLRVELLRFAHYYKLWQECKENEHKKYINVWVRYEARCVCNEIFMYEEKIKNLLRNLFLLDAQKTRRN